MFWKKSPSKGDGKPEVNRIDELANRLQKEGKIDSLEKELNRFDPARLQGAEKESWYHLHGIIPFRRGDRSTAFERFQDGLKHCPESGFLRFSLGQEHEFRGEIAQMLFYFDEATFPKIPSQYALAQARYAYLWDEIDKAVSYVEAIMPEYFKLKILDDHFLFMRGLPFFGQCWAYLAAFAWIKGDYSKLESFTQKAAVECSDFEPEILFSDLQALKTGDFSGTRQRLQALMDKWQKNGWPSGYHNMKLAVLNAQESPSFTDVEKMLDSVVLGEKDFPWLGDIRILAKCEAAHRSGNLELESKFQFEFFKHQPMLFEPDNAVNFNLLGYQERLKGIYRKSRLSKQS